mmetsp:Transcript_21530/g.38657  ORF Transcript_21530/g.38657 Transcript_21530/m.38657 type:complete len:240 (+) Transcript_21530:693-1412(+)
MWPGQTCTTPHCTALMLERSAIVLVSSCLVRAAQGGCQGKLMGQSSAWPLGLGHTPMCTTTTLLSVAVSEIIRYMKADYASSASAVAGATVWGTSASARAHGEEHCALNAGAQQAPGATWKGSASRVCWIVAVCASGTTRALNQPRSTWHRFSVWRGNASRSTCGLDSVKILKGQTRSSHPSSQRFKCSATRFARRCLRSRRLNGRACAFFNSGRSGWKTKIWRGHTPMRTSPRSSGSL